MSTVGNSFDLPNTPAELAVMRAEQSFSNDLDITLDDERLLAELDYAADELGFTNSSYFVESGRALIVAASFEASQPVTYTNFFGLTFEGRFATFSKVHIGRFIGGQSVRAVCLTFDDVTLLPYFDKTDEGDLLHIPVLAVDSMELT